MPVDADDLRRRFRTRFGGSATVHSAPGRVNLIGEHTDYNDGFVMPVAINRATSVAAGGRPDNQLVAHSESLANTADAPLDALTFQGGWRNYVFGVAAMLLRHGVSLPGTNLLIASDVPMGAGLSSSAALEVAVAYALVNEAKRPVDLQTLVRLCQQAENEIVGARCGIMDQFVAVYGRAGHALMLDCRSLHYQLIFLPRMLRLVICNTMVRHAIAAGEYNARRVDCEIAVRALAKRLPHVRALRDVTSDNLREHEDALSPVHSRRARHVVSENARVLAMHQALEQEDMTAIRRLMAESHRSLRDDFDVSCKELDTLVDLASTTDGIVGARMTGGGFGGCTVNLVQAAAVDSFCATMTEGYAREMNIRPDIYVFDAADGTAAAGPA